MNEPNDLSSYLQLSNGRINQILMIITVLVFLFLYAPIIAVVVLSFTPKSIPTLPLDGFSLKWYMRLVPPEYDETLVRALLRSIETGIASAIGAGIVGTFAAFGMVHYEIDSRLLNVNVLNMIFILPIVVPWTVTGVAVLTLYSLVGIQGTYLSLVVGHILIAIPFVILVVSTQLYQFDHSLEEAAQNLGANPFRTFYEVTLPIVSPGIIAGMLFAFTISFDNFTQTFFWVSTDTQTLPIVIYSKINHGLNPTINAIGTVVVTLSLIIAAAAEKLASRV